MFIFPMMYPKLPDDYDIPPTVYSILNSYVNYGNENPVKISELAKNGRAVFFDFDYPLASGLDKEKFECMILNHYMMRRIGYETMTAFKLALNVKLNEIMPMYNKLFESINNWNIFNDGESTSREQTTNNTSNSTSVNESNSNINSTTNDNNTSDRRFSDTPQSALDDVKNGTYVSQYNYDINSANATSNSDSTASTNITDNKNDTSNISETINRSPADKMSNYINFIEKKQNIYTMIFKDLDSLFYQVI